VSAIVRALRERPCMLHRFPRGVDGEKVHQKRIPPGAPPWLETVGDRFEVRVFSLPLREHIDEPVQEQLIVELYSK